jgi:hypothetical protein
MEYDYIRLHKTYFNAFAEGFIISRDPVINENKTYRNSCTKDIDLEDAWKRDGQWVCNAS